MTKEMWTIGAFTASLAFSGMAFAAGASESMGAGSASTSSSQQMPSFSDLDSNQDGFISKDEASQREEVAEALTENWENVDQNQDQQLDEAEFAQFELQQGGGATSPTDPMQQPSPEESMGTEIQ